MDEAIDHLQELLSDGFTGATVAEECGDGYSALVYLRWFSGGELDVVTVYGEHDATAYRASGMDILHPADTSAARVLWRDRGPVTLLIPAVLTWPRPSSGLRVRVRPADPHTVAARAEAVATP